MNKSHFFKEYFPGFLLYNLVFLFLQILYIFSSENSFIHAITYPSIVYWRLFVALLLQIGLYFILTWFQTELLWGIYPRYTKKISLDRLQLGIYFLTIAAIISVNCHFFPLSKISLIFFPEIPAVFLNVIMIMSLLILMGLTLSVLGRYCRKYLFLAPVISAVILLILFLPAKPITLQVSSSKTPNLIIIGVDSLSPEQISQALTPNLDGFLKHSVHFTETISPLARTYPAWATILTGLYPLHHHARENLYPPFKVNSQASFAWNFKQRGYRTVYATDERRFNNLGEEFGFEQIIGPQIGINDILMGSFYDFPLSNFLINWQISKWLLPYNYINRASFFSYYPATFDKALQEALKTGNNEKPLFLAVHFTLPHWPYAWATSSPAQVKNEYDIYDRKRLYSEAVQQADKQVGYLLQELQKRGALTNSVVILLSDHGEVLYKKGSRKTGRDHYQGSLSKSAFVDYLKRKTSTELEVSVGHGSDLLSTSQDHCVLGFKLFKQGKLLTKPATIATRVALIDIAPTIAELYHFSLNEKPDGISLMNTIINQVPAPRNRFFMIESGMLPNQSLAKDKLIEYAQTLFEVNPKNTHIEIQKNQLVPLNQKKLYGVIYNEWLLALYPDDTHYIPVLLRLNDNYWVDDINSPFTKSSPVEEMLAKLRQFYAVDLANYPLVLNQSI
ncbi:MAG: sulfatase-like hydrolase/transferase [Legionella sp.]|nr:sulfatase-like hydrolase/transferase [Legionella sp.]